MTIAVEVLTSIDQLDAAAYRSLRRSCAASPFYDPRVLTAFERAPLLPVEKTYYLAAYEGPALVGFMPAYLQAPAVVDPFDVLRQTTSTRFEAGARGLFSHVMHCYDTTVIGTGGVLVLAPLLERLAALAQAEGAQHFVIMNVAEGPLLAEARGLGLEVSYMFDRYCLDLSGIRDFDALVLALPPAGRHEMRRQLRRFEGTGARAAVERAPFDRIDELAQLCHRTTARRGTPQYLPPAPLANLLSSCGDLLRFVVIYDVNDRMVAGFICIDDGPTFHMWLGGVIYEGLAFSPYTVAFAASYRYALAQGKQRIEAGRLNAKIKHRLGLSPMPLHAIVSPDLRARAGAVTGKPAFNSTPARNNGPGRPSSVS
jgi:hypothetical protein